MGSNQSTSSDKSDPADKSNISNARASGFETTGSVYTTTTDGQSFFNTSGQVSQSTNLQNPSNMQNSSNSTVDSNTFYNSTLPTTSNTTTSSGPNFSSSVTTTTNATTVPLGYLLAFANIVNASPEQSINQYPRNINELIGTWNQNGTRAIQVILNGSFPKEAIFVDPVTGLNNYLSIGKGNYIIFSLDSLANNPSNADRNNMRIKAFGHMPNPNQIDVFTLGNERYTWMRMTTPPLNGNTPVNSLPTFTSNSYNQSGMQSRKANNKKQCKNKNRHC